MGRNAILLISAAIICQLFGVIVVYYIVFSDTLSLLVGQAITGSQITQILPPEQMAAELSAKPSII